MFITIIDNIDYVIRRKQAIQVNRIYKSSKETELDII